MKRLSLAIFVAAIAALSVWAVESAKVGRIDYVEGSVTISRAGKVIEAPNIDDDIISGDLIKTASDGLLVIALDKSTGMNGTITVRAKSDLYLNLQSANGEPKTAIDLLAGSVASKVSKIAASPAMTVTTGNAVMGVRGTEYEVAVSVNEAVLVTCTEGQVACSDGTDELPVPAGKVLEKRPGEKLRYIPVAVSTIKEFSQRWIADEIEAFKADAPRALADYEKRYSDYSARFAQAFDPFQKSAVLKKWLDEDRTGAPVNPLDPAVLRDKKEMAGYLLNLRKVLFIFERIYYRVDELADIIRGTPDERVELRPGLVAGDFLSRVQSERDQLARSVALFHYAEKLYGARNPDGDVFGNNQDFFGGSGGF